MEQKKDSPLRVFQVITKANWGGAQVYTKDIIDAEQAFNTVNTLVYGEAGTLSDLTQQKATPSIHIPSLGRNISFFNDCKTVYTLWKLFKKEKPDAVHLHSSKALFISSIAARLAKVPRIIATAHGWPYNESRSAPQKHLFYFLTWITMLCVHVLICVSQAVAKEAPQLLVSQKIQTIYNGITPFSVYGRENARAMLGIPANHTTHVFGSIGELHTNKGFDILIRAFRDIHKNHPNTHLAIIGDGEKRKELAQWIHKEKLEAHITLLGHIHDAKEYLKAFTTFVLPSRTEALGYVLLEAALAKIPRIATRAGGIPEHIHHKKTGLLVEKEDVRELRLAMEYALSHPEKMALYAQEAYNYVLQNYSQENMLRAIYTIYLDDKICN